MSYRPRVRSGGLLRHGLALIVLLGHGCAGQAHPRNASDTPGDEPALERADVAMACGRDDASGWTQIVFRSKKWRELAQRADARDPQAWEAIADAFEAHNRSTPRTPCSKRRIAEIRATAARLTQ